MAATLEFRLTGGAGNSDPNASLGGVMSSTVVSATAMNNLFDDVAAAEASSGDTEYRAIDVYNVGDATATVVKIWIDPQTSSPSTSLEIGEETANNPHTSAWSGQTIADESTAPSNPAVTFGEHGPAAKLSLADIPAGQAARIWVRRIVQAGAGNTANDQATLNVEYA